MTSVGTLFTKAENLFLKTKKLSWKFYEQRHHLKAQFIIREQSKLSLSLHYVPLSSQILASKYEKQFN